MTSKWLTLMVCLWIPACSLTYRTVGDDLPAARDQLLVGTSSKSDALRLLGPPIIIRRQFDGELFVYRQEKSHFRSLTLIPFLPIFYYSDGEAKRNDMTLLFDQNAILRGIGTLEQPED